MKIAFHSNQLSVRGTEVAMYDYAHFNETILCNESIILAKHPDVWAYSNEPAIEKFKKRFPVFFYKNVSEIEKILDENNVDILYAIKAGLSDDIISKKHKTVVHSVFQYEEPHGQVYAYVSEWLSKLYGNRHPFVPHIVYLPEENGDLREQLGIPKNAIVYGRHGGFETFDISFAKEAVLDVARNNPNIYFVFMNTQKFSDESENNILYLNSTADLNEKVKFINTCDAMLHARVRGETFGLSIAEFSIKNKPIITCKDAYYDRAHLDLLGNVGIYYSNKRELVELLINHTFLDKKLNWNCYNNYNPEKVMQKFKSVFIDGSKTNF